jgi:hypothetical protein
MPVNEAVIPYVMEVGGALLWLCRLALVNNTAFLLRT